MLKRRDLVSLPFVVALFAVVGCNSPPVRATWGYTELVKGENGQINEVGKKHTLNSGGDEMYEIPGKGLTLDVVSVTSKNVKFRLSNKDSVETKIMELQPGGSQDIWLGDAGVRVRVDTIGPIGTGP
jgi:hypothetical protein